MLGAAFVRPSPRLLPVLAALPLAAWTVFHLWEQLAAFAGRDAWIERMSRTSAGGLAITIELVAIVAPLALWAGLVIRELARRRPLPGAASADDGLASRTLARLAPFAAVTAIVFLAIHVGHLWAPKIVLGASTAETWWSLGHDLGRPWMLVTYAIGLSAVAIHLAIAVPAALGALGWVETAGARRQAILVAAVFALCVWILAVQLAGWLATGHGTFWSIEVIEAT